MDKNRLYFSWSYPDQKYSEALDTLATSFAPNWQRMTYALMSISNLLEAHFPDKDLYERTRAVMDRSTKFGPLMLNGKVYQGSIEHTMRRSRRLTFEKLATEIFAIYSEIQNRRGPYVE